MYRLKLPLKLFIAILQKMPSELVRSNPLLPPDMSHNFHYLASFLPTFIVVARSLADGEELQLQELHRVPVPVWPRLA